MIQILSAVSISIGLLLIAGVILYSRMNTRKPNRSNCYYDEHGKPVMWVD